MLWSQQHGRSQWHSWLELWLMILWRSLGTTLQLLPFLSQPTSLPLHMCQSLSGKHTFHCREPLEAPCRPAAKDVLETLRAFVLFKYSMCKGFALDYGPPCTKMQGHRSKKFAGLSVLLNDATLGFSSLVFACPGDGRISSLTWWRFFEPHSAHSPHMHSPGIGVLCAVTDGVTSGGWETV